MNFVLIFIVVIYAGLVMGIVKRFMTEVQSRMDAGIAQQKQDYEELIQRKKFLYEEKMQLENEALRIFTLYEMTKEITKCLNEKEAFESFKQKLKEKISFKECSLLEPLSDKIKNFNEQNQFTFLLQGKSGQVGVLVIEGLAEQDQEKAVILGHQFALALRRVKLYEEIEKIAITDSLTVVHTRRYFLERFQEEMKRSRLKNIKLSLLMIDVDFFKQFNDHYGHLTGDQILRAIGLIIKENIREIDIAGRFGGEEFTVVLPDTDSAGAQFAAERIRKATDEALIKAYDANIKATVSIGIATFPADGHSAEELIDKSDWALYRAKKQGRNRVCIFGVYKN